MLAYIKWSAWRGLLAGILFSLAYIALVVPLTGLLLVVTNLFTGRAFEAIIGAGILTTCAWPFSFFLGILPGAFLGVVGGVIVGCILAPWREHLKPGAVAVIGAGLVLLAILVINLIFAPRLLDPEQPGFSQYIPYLFWLAGPSLFAIPAATWAGWSLQKGWLAHPA